MAISGIGGERPSFDPPVSAAQAVPVAGAPAAESPFARAMHGLAHEIDVGEARTASASQLRNYDTGTLIALQVGIYRYTEAVDLASKIVDRATNAVRTVLQGGGH